MARVVAGTGVAVDAELAAGVAATGVAAGLAGVAAAGLAATGFLAAGLAAGLAAAAFTGVTLAPASFSICRVRVSTLPCRALISALLGTPRREMAVFGRLWGAPSCWPQVPKACFFASLIR